MTSRRNQLLKKLIGTATGEDEKKALPADHRKSMC